MELECQCERQRELQNNHFFLPIGKTLQGDDMQEGEADSDRKEKGT